MEGKDALQDDEEYRRPNYWYMVLLTDVRGDIVVVGNISKLPMVLPVTRLSVNISNRWFLGMKILLSVI